MVGWSPPSPAPDWPRRFGGSGGRRRSHKHEQIYFFLTYVNGGRREGRRRDDVGRRSREGKRVPDGIAHSQFSRIRSCRSYAHVPIASSPFSNLQKIKIAVKSLAQASRTHGRVSPYRATHREGPGKPGDSNLRRPEVREGLTPQPASAGKGLNTHTYGSATLTR